MKTSANVASMQNFLNSKNVTPHLKEDGIWGSVSQGAFQNFITSDLQPSGWEFLTDKMEIAGDDVIYRGQNVTWFGGDNDPQDNGETASGTNTKHNPTLQGCALAMDFGDKVPNTKFAPMQPIPWFTMVQFYVNGLTQIVKLIDVGPAKYTKNGGDLTQAVFRLLSPSGTTKEGVLKNVTIRIIGGAKYANHARPT